MPPRIVSLIPSATEIVAALSYAHCLVGRSHECDFPPEVRHLPICCEPRIDVSASSIEIDRQVKATLANALSIYRVFNDRLAELRPSLILTQTLCDVCAVSLRDVEVALCGLADSQPRIVSLSPMTLSDVWTNIQQVADAIADPAAGQRLVTKLQQRLDQLSNQVANQPRPTVVCIEWLDPLMSAGNWVPELVTLAGGQPLLASAGQHSPWLSWDDLFQADPDKIILIPCGFDLARTRHELPSITKHPRWSSLRAVQQNEIYLADGHQLFNRPGPRLVDSVETISQILFPAIARPTHHFIAWEQHTT